MEEIRHSGIVTGKKSDTLFVTIVSQSACSSCHAKGVCHAGDMKEKVVEVADPDHSYEIGQHVTVLLQESDGFRALLLGYVTPFFVVLVSLIIVLSVSGDEIATGMIALFMLVPYYAVLYLFRDRMKKRFRFKVVDTYQNSL